MPEVLVDMLVLVPNQLPNQPPLCVFALVKGAGGAAAAVEADEAVAPSPAGRCSAGIPMEERMYGPAMDFRRRSGLGLA